MIKLITGKKGTGKTKILIDMINEMDLELMDISLA